MHKRWATRKPVFLVTQRIYTTMKSSTMQPDSSTHSRPRLPGLHSATPNKQQVRARRLPSISDSGSKARGGPPVSTSAETSVARAYKRLRSTSCHRDTALRQPTATESAPDRPSSEKTKRAQVTSAPPPALTSAACLGSSKATREKRRTERIQQIQGLVDTIAALRIECAIEPRRGESQIAPAADGDGDEQWQNGRWPKHRQRSMSPRANGHTGKPNETPNRSRPQSHVPHSSLPSRSHRASALSPSRSPSCPPHYAIPTLASQQHQRGAIRKSKSNPKFIGGSGSGPRHRQNSPTRTLPIPAAPSRPPPLELKSLALLHRIKSDTDPVARLTRPRRLALPRPFLGLSRLEDLGGARSSHDAGGQRGAAVGADDVGVGRSARVALHKAIEAQLEDLYRELDSETGVYGGLGKEVRIADAVGPGFKAGIDDWELGADMTMTI